MKKCEECSKEIAKNKSIQVKTDITWYFCGWGCLGNYCSKMLNIMDEGE